MLIEMHVIVVVSGHCYGDLSKHFVVVLLSLCEIFLLKLVKLCNIGWVLRPG